MSKPLDILVVDDSDADRTLIGYAFKKVAENVNLHFCKSGQDALDFLAACSNSAQSSMPKVCLLDINMPGLSGFDVLKAIKSDNRIKALSVYMFSSSDNPQDIALSYANASNGFLLKPRTQSELGNLVKSLVYLWTGPQKFLPPHKIADLAGESALNNA